MLRFAITFTLLSLLICGLTYRLLRNRLNLSKRSKRLLLVFLSFTAVIMIVAPVVYRAAEVSIENPFQQALQFSQYFLMGWVAMTMLTFLGLEFAQLLYHAIRWGIDRFNHRFRERAFDPSKRIFLTEGVARTLVAATTVSAVGGLIQANYGPLIKEVKIKLPTLPGAFDQLVMTQISDVHIGPMLHEDFLNHVVEQVMSTNPDIILITGDLVDGTVEQLKNFVEPLKRLKAKEGIYFCTGNHEYYSGAEEWIAYLETMGIHVFRNSNQILKRKNASGTEESLLLAGVYDWQGGRYSENHIPDAMKAANTSEAIACKILLAHNPQSTDENAKAGFNLQLSGHTHAGQFYPFVFLAKIAHKYFEGLYQVNENMQVYVNRGTGYWGPPNRLGKSSEVTKIILSNS